MSDNLSGPSKARSILTKAYEISYALFRIASQIAEKDFSEQLRVSGAALLAQAAGEDYQAAAQSLHVMECLVKFAGDVNIIGVSNSDVLLREIYALDAAITEIKNIPKADQFNVAEIFSKSEVAPEPAIRQSAKESQPEQGIFHKVYEPEIKQYEEPEPIAVETSEAATPNINTILKSAIRQTAILERIRQTGNCRLKDIQEILPDASERTIRYDLQTLLEQDLIERVGTAGPSVYYRSKQIA